MASQREVKLFRDVAAVRTRQMQRSFACWCDFYRGDLEELFEFARSDPNFDLSYEEFCHWTFQNTDNPLVRLRKDQKAAWSQTARDLWSATVVNETSVSSKIY